MNRTRKDIVADKKALCGWASIFREKSTGDRLQGTVTKRGSERFEAARRALARLAKRKVTRVSDADTMEYLARGEAETRAYLAGQRP